MVTIPLQYESLKAVLPYLDANIRFQISLCIPSLSSLEKRIPLKIKNLTFSKNGTTVNQFSYQVGDVDLSGEFFDMDLDYSEEKEHKLIQKLRIYKILLTEFQVPAGEDDICIESVPWDGSLESNIRDYAEWFEPDCEYIRSEFKSEVQTIRETLAPYIYRRNNTKPPYTPLIQFTTRSPKGSTTIQRYAYNKHLFEALKVLNNKFFEKRSSVISVKHLNIEFNGDIIRFPTGYMLRIDELEGEMRNAFQFEALKKIIDTSSFPLNKLEIFGLHVDSADFSHQIVRETKTLVISAFTLEGDLWSPFLRDLPNRRVILKNSMVWESRENYVDLIEDWLERGRPVGTFFTMCIRNEDIAKQCLDTLKQREEVIKFSEKQVQFKIGAALILNVSYEFTGEPAIIYNDYDSKWVLHLKVSLARSD
ncbi:hypothetical protein GCK72_004392 [Caenorhabditis remanei]|uniref:Uncharacterized protein n=1 Tax=Caenorhabditis remanei TaxID=31234 RepID=A0A6A5HC93_CAERE|nr:hypothetical protein GCK72_004392 [Caenorhabditis remanei]KAF1764444.1 hypothetical protein GCK72_004392 [Caenorhabditis remanei]